MRGLARLILSLCALPAAMFFPDHLSSAWDWARDHDGHAQELAQLIDQARQRHGVAVVTAAPTSSELAHGVAAQQAHPALQLPAARAVLTALEAYPAGHAQRIGLGRVRVLSFGLGASVGGFVNSDLGRDTLYVEALQPSLVPTLHHEMHHLAEIKAGAPDWSRFGGHEEKRRDLGPLFGLCDSYQYGPPGFARWYGRTTPAEDRATVAERLFADPELAGADAELLAKADVIRGFYARLSDGAMDQGHWARLPAMAWQRRWLAPICG